MSNTKKLLQTVAVAGAVTATGAIATTTAHADAAVAQPSATATDAQSQLDNLKNQQQASEAAMAQDNQNQMQAATSAANSQIANLNQQIQANNAKQAAANSAAIASGTAQINSDAAQATNAENAQYSDAVAKQQAANSQALAEASKNIVTPAQKQAQTSAENANYNQAVDAAKAAHDQANAQLKSDYDSQNAKINQQIQDVQNAQSKDQQQKLADATAKVDGQIQDATNAVRDANAKVNSDQSAVQTAQSQVKTAQGNYDQAVNKYNAAKSEQGSESQGQLSTDYPEFDVIAGDGNGVYNIVQPLFHGQMQPWQDEDPVDNATKLHFDADGNLSTEDQNIANVFAANIINHMRSQIGSPLVKVSAEGNAMEKRLMDLDSQLSPNAGSLHHTSEATQQLMNEGAIITRAENAVLSDGTFNNDGVTVADLKNEIYTEINEWLGETHNVDANQPFGHRYILLGVNGYGVDNPTVALNIFANPSNTGIYCNYLDVFDIPGTQHYVTLANNGQATTPAKPAVDLNALQQAVNTAKSALDAANAALKSAQNQLATDQAAYTKANNHLNQLKANRDQAIKDLAGTASSVADQINALKKQANDLATSYQAKFKAENDQYQQKLNDLKADHQKKLDAINAQPSDVNALKAQLAQKLADLKTKHEANLTKIKSDAQAKIDALKAKLSDNTAANQPILDQIAKIKDGLSKKQAELDAKLAALKDSDAKAYQQLHDQLFPKNTDVVNGKTDHMKTDNGTEIVLPGKDNGNVAENIAATYPTREQYRESQQEAGNLPQTGNTNSAVIALGAISAMLGLGLAARKQRY